MTTGTTVEVPSVPVTTTTTVVTTAYIPTKSTAEVKSNTTTVYRTVTNTKETHQATTTSPVVQETTTRESTREGTSVGKTTTVPSHITTVELTTGFTTEQLAITSSASTAYEIITVMPTTPVELSTPFETTSSLNSTVYTTPLYNTTFETSTYPVCIKGCAYNDIVYDYGESWTVDECTTCHCSNETYGMICTNQRDFCTPSCPTSEQLVFT